VILYTPMQLELVLEGFDPTKYPEYREVVSGGSRPRAAITAADIPHIYKIRSGQGSKKNMP
jgi:hypothetical protein